ncbi:MAG: GNAT family N-acetyltransferase [Phycisphaerae bacterium]
MNLRIVPEDQVTAELDAEIRRGLCACFPTDAAAFSTTRAWHGSGPAFSVVLEEGSVVVAHVGVVDRTIDLDGRALRVAGVQNVYVLPEHRGRWLADQVMAAAMNEAGRTGYDCGLLFCVPRLTRLYARQGWRLLEGVDVTCLGPTGRDEPLPGQNVAMWYPLRVRELTGRRMHLCGADW